MIRRLSNPLRSNSFLMFGARGVGKSTFIKSQFLDRLDDCKCIDLLDGDEEEKYSRDPKLLEREWEALKKKPKWIFIDEVQKVPKLLDHVHRMIENKGQKFILSGSSARKLKRSGANLLAGRAYLYPLFPFVSQELKGKWNLDRAIQFGTLPKAYFSESDLDAKNFLKSYVQTYLKEEIRVEQLVRQFDPFRDFLEVAAQMSGQVINHSKIAREVGVSDKTIVSYFQILEDTHLGFILPAFHRSIRKGQAEHPKFYLFDLGVKSALQRNLDNRIAPGTASYGEAFEHIVVNEFLRMNEYSQKDYKISFFRNKEGAEIDLILSHGRKEEILIEIKSSKKIDEVEVKKLGRASHEFNAKKVYFLSADPSRQMIGKVTCLPWEIGLTEVFC